MDYVSKENNCIYLNIPATKVHSNDEPVFDVQNVSSKPNDGEQQWYQNGKFHRDNDQPAIILNDEILNDETQIWYQNGNRHRDNDLPAIMWSDGTQEWYQNGKLHRDNNLPAIINSDGKMEWYMNGIRQEEGEIDASDIKG